MNEHIGSLVVTIDVHKVLGPGLLEAAWQGIHETQLLTCPRLAKNDNGFLIDFNVKLLKQGIESFVL